MAGISYYRLSQTDIDGQIRYYDVKKINNTKAKLFAVSQVANDNGMLILQIKTAQQENVQIRIFDITGKEIIKNNIIVSAGTNLRTIALKSGSYVWEVKNNHGERATQVTIVK